MNRCAAALLVAALGLSAWGCGSAYSNNNAGPTGPSPSGGALTIDVVAIRGSQSFSPDPATVPAGQMVVWHNVDTITHRVVLNDRSVDTGNLNPGAFSPAMAIGSPGPYHCSIHPEMIGSLR